MSTPDSDDTMIANRLDRELDLLPAGPSPSDYLRGGRRALRRRRIVTGATALGATVAVLGVTAFAGAFQGAEPTLTPAQFAAMPGSDITDRCADSENASRASKERLFGSGPAELMATASSGTMSHSAIRSADGKFWGHCFLRLDEGGEFSSGLTLHSTEPSRESGWSFTHGPGCRLEAGQTTKRSCDRFSFSMVDRRDPEVARVKVVTADGQVSDVATNEGYFAIAVTGKLPEGVAIGPGGILENFEPIREMSLYDAEGELLASHDFTKPTRYRDGNEVEPLDEYPSIAGEQLD